MKGIKRLLGMFVAVMALTCSLAVPAFANEAGVQTDENGITELCFTKNVDATGTTLPAATFTFTMTPVTVADGTTINGMDVKTGVALTTSTTTLATTDLTDNGSSGTTLKYTGEGKFTLPTDLDANTVYRYEVKESDSGGYTQNNRTYQVDLYTNNEGTIIAVTSTETSGAEDAKEPIVFLNTKSTETTSLTISKQVAGAFSSTSQEFTFKLTLKALGDSYPNGATIAVTKYTKDGENVESSVQDITIGTEYTFTLKHGGSLLINNLPVGMEYTIVEEAAAGYTTTAKSTLGGTEQEGTEGATVTHSLMSGTNATAFTNTRDTTTVTGIALDVAPYVGVFAVAALGIVAFALKRRRNAAELDD